jgi:hypothetical protein
MHLHYLHGVLSFYFAEVIKNIKVTNSIKSVDENVITVVDDKIDFIKYFDDFLTSAK